MPDLLTQLEEYGRQLDEQAGDLTVAAPGRRMARDRRTVQRPFLVAAAAALVTFVAIGAAAWLIRNEPPTLGDTTVAVPETWTTWTADDGVVSDCACQMAMAPDGSFWIVGFDGISRYDGQGWQRIEPPRPFGEGYPAVAPAPDGSVWVSGASYLAQYADGVWDPVIEAGYGADEGDPLSFAWLEVDAEGRVWTNLNDEDGRIEDGAFVPTELALTADDVGFVAPEGVGILATAPDGSIWLGIGDSIAGVEGALLEYDGERYLAHDLGGVRAAVFDDDGTGWFIVNATTADSWMFGREQWADPGLYRRDADGDWYHLTTADGLPGYRLSDLILAPDGALWISTADGTVTRYQPGTDPEAGVRVEIATRHFATDEFKRLEYPPPTEAPAYP